MALNPQQEAAVRIRKNVVVTAGAGAGKTTVLAMRYAHLVMYEHLAVDQILTLTFTNKATNEMYERIYKTLIENSDNPWAKKAIDNFYKANIETIDSFCAKIARSGAAFFGIAPDFASGEAKLIDTIKDSALGFTLDNRENKALQTIIADKKIQSVAESLFAVSLLNYSPITQPLSFKAMFDAQLNIITKDYYSVTACFEEALKQSKKTIQPPSLPSIEDVFTGKEEAKTAFFAYLDFVRKIRGYKEIAMILLRIANFALHKTVIEETYALLDEFQSVCNRKKRTARLLTFSDTARLAVDTLSRFPEIRRSYKTQIKAIMVDEFQDNNSLQKDLIFLLAEDERRMEAGLPSREELSPDKLFFVGDEKQSIYRFRGADVSVFRALNEDLPDNAGAENPCDHTIHLETNYRSRAELIAAFNIIFKRVFNIDGRKAEKYDADFNPLGAGRGFGGETQGCHFLHFALLMRENMNTGESAALSSYDLEAVFIARKIREIIKTGSCLTILKKNTEGTDFEAPCTYGDIAILLRKKSHQNEIERQLKSFGIPYNAEEPVSLFNDARINDIIAYLRLLVYPRDTLSYASLLRSSFVRLSDTALSICLLNFHKIPFDENCASLLPVDDRTKYIAAAAVYRELRGEFERGHYHIEELITKLWYEAGCRFETLLTSSKETQAEVYDYFFELGCRAQADGQTLAMFLTYIDDLQKQSFESATKKLEQFDLPIERSPGVRLLTIHKSKGLEFPVVFVYGCGDTEKSHGNRGNCYYADSEDGGLLTLNLPHAPELKGEKPQNYFYAKYQDEEKKKAEAELRRLLYVAATRAESRLFFTGTFPKLTKEENASNLYDQEQPLQKRVKLYRDKILKTAGTASFLKMVTGVLACDEYSEHFTLEEIPVLTRAKLYELTAKIPDTKQRVLKSNGLSAEMLETIRGAKTSYEKTLLDEAGTPSVVYMTASGMENENTGQTRYGAGQVKIPRIVSSDTISAADFGALVHSVIEDRFSGIVSIAAKKGPLKKAQTLADNFFDSALGKKSLAAAFRKTEYSFVSFVEDGGKKIYTNGKIDLLFIDADGLCIVDYKSDRDPDTSRHLAQLCVYRHAAQNLFPSEKEIHTYLFFLREGRAVEVKPEQYLKKF